LFFALREGPAKAEALERYANTISTRQTGLKCYKERKWKFSKDRLEIPASSATVERLLSSATNSFSQTLKSETINQNIGGSAVCSCCGDRYQKCSSLAKDKE
jgi:hypothetical protein